MALNILQQPVANWRFAVDSMLWDEREGPGGYNYY